jgi:hypothetical protein
MVKRKRVCKKRAVVKRRKQRGGNMFGMLNKINQYVNPFQQLAPRAIATGMQMANDIKSGKNWKEAALDRIPEALKQVVAGKPFQLGSGVRRRRTRKRNNNGVHS